MVFHTDWYLSRETKWGSQAEFKAGQCLTSPTKSCFVWMLAWDVVCSVVKQMYIKGLPYIWMIFSHHAPRVTTEYQKINKAGKNSTTILMFLYTIFVFFKTFCVCTHKCFLLMLLLNPLCYSYLLGRVTLKPNQFCPVAFCNLFFFCFVS